MNRLIFGIGSLILMSTTLQAETPDRKAARAVANMDTLMAYYPPQARAAGQEGLVAFTVSLDRDGHPTSCQVTHSSGFVSLDEETCPVLLAHAEFAPDVNAAGTRVAGTHQGVINWQLHGYPPRAPLVAPIVVASNKAPDKMVCHRTVRTGTIADYERICMTAAEWKRGADEVKHDWEEITRNSKTGN